MPVRRSPLFDVLEEDAEVVLQEVAVRAAARKKAQVRTYDPELGETYEEAEQELDKIRADVGRYGEYVYGLKPAAVHSLWNKVADDVINRRVEQNKVLFIAPPNSAKSTWNSLIRTTYHLGRHPDESILFFTSSDPMARTFYAPVESALRENEKHRTVFPSPDARPDRKKGWSTDGLYLKGRPPHAKDPSYKAVGSGATIMGARANGVQIDDPLDQDEAQSETVQKKAKQYSDQTITPRIQIGTGWMIAVMTRFHEADLASHYISLAEKSGDWIVIRTPMIATNDPEPDPLGRQTGELLWPERMTEVFVRNEQRRLTIAEFNLVHQGDPTGMGGDIFEAEGWFQDLPDNFWSDILPRCQIVQGWDMVFSEKDRACFTVGVTAAVDAQLNMYIIHVLRGRYNLGDLENQMVSLMRITRPIIVGMEEDPFHQHLTRNLVRRIQNRIMVNLVTVKPDKDKIMRARLPASRAQAGKVFINKRADWHRAFITECLGFPNTKFKDQVDAFSLTATLVEQIETLQAEVQDMVIEFAMG